MSGTDPRTPSVPGWENQPAPAPAPTARPYEPGPAWGTQPAWGPPPAPPARPEDQAREEALRQIERKRRFRTTAVISGIGMILLTFAWMTSEFHNAGGWPTDGFSSRSSLPHVWNYWIIYPVTAWLLFLGARAWPVYGNKPVTEAEIQREIDRTGQ
ncbi:2TM domain-containing protein [Streptomyces vinaceus]|uniref:2TM domain-containing protein n=1 Tax=Streptomyces vinaceus TaxID=1960 RepID=UPI0037F33E7B